VAIRDAHAAKYDYDIRRIGEALMAEQAAGGRKLFYGKPKPLQAQDVAPRDPEPGADD
jgi:hypothetical protein